MLYPGFSFKWCNIRPCNWRGLCHKMLPLLLLQVHDFLCDKKAKNFYNKGWLLLVRDIRKLGYRRYRRHVSRTNPKFYACSWNLARKLSNVQARIIQACTLHSLLPIICMQTTSTTLLLLLLQVWTFKNLVQRGQAKRRCFLRLWH